MQLSVTEEIPTTRPPAITYHWPTAMDAALGIGVIELYNDSIRTEDVLGYQSLLTPDEGRKVIERLSQAMSRKERHFFGIYSHSRLVGMALLTPNGLPNCRHIVEWSKGIIHSAYRGRGVLQPALIALAQHCRAVGWDIVTLDVRANSRSHKIWSLAGFQEYGRLPDYARIDGESRAGVYLYAQVDDIISRAEG
jgi:RimJ/RimL family protein N-acetyltransferase